MATMSLIFSDVFWGGHPLRLKQPGLNLAIELEALENPPCEIIGINQKRWRLAIPHVVDCRSILQVFHFFNGYLVPNRKLGGVFYFHPYSEK